MKNERKIEPIYEKLAPNEAFIICRNEDGSFDIIENINGNVVFRRVSSIT